MSEKTSIVSAGGGVKLYSLTHSLRAFVELIFGHGMQLHCVRI